MPAVAPQLLSIIETADQLGVTERHVRRLIQRGDLPYVRIGRRVLIADVALANFIEANTVGARA